MSERTAESIFTCTVNLVDSRQVTVNGNFYADEDLAARDAKLDQIMGILDRQRDRYELGVFEKELEQRYKALEQTHEQLQLHLKEAQKLSAGKPKQRMEQQNVEVLQKNIERIKEDIDKGIKALEACRARIERRAA
jgi:superfamily II RNA helicase